VAADIVAILCLFVCLWPFYICVIPTMVPV